MEDVRNTPLGHGRPGLLEAIFVAPFAPRYAARRLDRLTMLDAWLLHIAMVMAFLAMIGCIDAAGPEFEWHHVRRLPKALLGYPASWSDEFWRDPVSTSLRWSVITASVEFGFLGLAALLAPWGARDEPLRVSFTVALRRAWIFSIAALWAVALVGAASLDVATAEARWDAAYPRPVRPDVSAPPAPDVQPTEPGYQKSIDQWTAEMAQYKQATDRYDAQWRQWRFERPWYRRDGKPFLFTVGFLAGFGTFIALLRGVAAPRCAPNNAVEPTCGRCGRTLFGLAPDAPCPSCARASDDSTGDRVPDDLPWERRGELGWGTAWWRTFCMSELRPSELGQRLRESGSADHRLYVAMWMPVLFIVGAAGIAGGIWVAGRWNSFCTDDLSAIAICAVGGTSVMTAATLVMLAGACVVGWVSSLKARRNLWPAAMRISACLAGNLWLWSVVGAVAFVAIVWWSRDNPELRQLASRLGTTRGWLLLGAWLLPNALMGIRFLVLLAKGTNAARGANR